MSTVIHIEDFEDNSGFDASIQFRDGTRDYFQRTDGSDITTGPSGAPTTYSGFVGGTFFAAADVDDGGGNGNDLQWVDIDQIDVSGFTDLTVSGLFASAGGASFDSTDYLAVLYSVDDGAEYLPGLVFNFARTEPSDSFNEVIGLNETPQFTTSAADAASGLGDFTGTGDADITSLISNSGSISDTLTSEFQQFDFAITNASTLDIRIALHADAAGEEIAFDQFVVSGVVIDPPAAVPLPAGFSLLLGALAVVWGIKALRRGVFS